MSMNNERKKERETKKISLHYPGHYRAFTMRISGEAVE